ncbi:peptidase U62 modulator of DNA gyrase [Candidatus Magnetoovum chiemensis]|nr:peptidase U62 modulator of DNA gyrase [Candidatus Magnetoovum chiemensis]
MASDNGENQLGFDYEGSRYLKDLSCEKVGKEAAKRAVSLFGSKTITSRKSPLILDNSTAADFIGILTSALNSENAQKGKSLFCGKLKAQVLSPKVNILDDGLISGKFGTRPFDSEGVASMRKTVIEGGILKGFLYNTSTAKKEKNTVSTANALRGGIKSLPGVGVSNLYIEPASKEYVFNADNAYEALGSGLYVNDVMGMHTANAVTGEFSVGANGLWIEKGKPVYAVKEAVISGNILDFLSKIELIGNDLKFYGNIASPSLLISEADISG